MNTNLLLLMDDPQLQRLYGRLLSRRGHQVTATDDVARAERIATDGDVDLAIVDADLETFSIADADQWLNGSSSPALILLKSPDPIDHSNGERLFQSTPPPIAELTLQKPLSPMELGIQVDHLLGGEPESTLQEDSRADRDFNAMQREFIYQLDEDLAAISEQWTEVENAPKAPQRAAIRLRKTVAAVRASARHFGFAKLADDLETLEGLLGELLAPESRLSDADRSQGRILLSNIRSICQTLQKEYPADALIEDNPGHTFLVVAPDREFLEGVEELGEQFVVRIRTAESIEEAIKRCGTPLLTGVILSVDTCQSTAKLRDAIDALREASPLQSLPIALVGSGGEDLDRVRNLWTGASVLVSRPLTASKFARTARRLADLRRAQKSTVLVIEPEPCFADELTLHLDTNQVAVHCHSSPSNLFEHLERHQPNMLVVDAHLRGVSSFDICRAIRAIPRWQHLPIVMVADNDQPELRVAAYEAGADDFVCRRLPPEELRARIRVRLQRARLLKQRADRDSLTGLLTRRAFLERLAARLSEAERRDLDLSFCLIDVDHFKRINDTYGHPTGDRVLEKLGQLLRDRFRIEDLRCRWGGEEFAIVLVDEDRHTAHRALERVRREFSELEFTDDDGTPFEVTFSAGLAEYPTDGSDPETLLDTADARLLRAKQQGRNHIEAGGLR